MSQQRDLILSIAVSDDGFIATPDGGLDWLPQPRAEEDYGHAEFLERIDCVVMGRNAWEFVSDHDGGDYFSQFDCHVLSREDIVEGFWMGDGIGYIHELKEQDGLDIWLVGGGILSGECLEAGIIDEVILTEAPLTLGEGLPLFGEYGTTVPDSWSRVSERKFSDGLIQKTFRPL